MSEEAPAYGPAPAQVRRGERTPLGRAVERAKVLKALTTAYEAAAGHTQAPFDDAVVTILVEALKLWEREHMPEPLDKLLLDRALGR